MVTDTTPSMTAVEAPYGLRLADPIEGAQFTLLTQRPVTPASIDPSTFAPPVDTAAVITATTLETPYQVDALVRDDELSIVAECTSSERTAVGPGEYYVELSSAKMKLYLYVEGEVVFEPGTDQVRLSFPGASELRVGVRSLHEQPAATITTTDDLEALATALSQLGSALKTTSCERSFPTLRGHPPLIERGPELSVPAALSAPETGVTIEVPPRLDALLPITSLAYYLGATVEIGSRPMLHADGWSHSLDGDDGFETTVARVLKQVFLLDCVTRTEGMYDVPLYERDRVEAAVDLDFPALYDQPLAEQVRQYLQVPYEAVAEAVPTWKLTADVVPESSALPVLPFLADELAVVRCPDDPTATDGAKADLSPKVTSFFDTSDRGGEAFVRSTATRSETATRGLDQTVFTPEPADSIEQTYVGEGIPLGASKMSVEEYDRRLEFDASSRERTRILVVCNDPQMSDENVVGDIYGTREWIEFDITTREQVTTDELADLLAADADFFHYIGHVDPDGIRCTDGHLDAETLTEVGVNAFLLNACQSYSQGRALIDAGAIGGIVTLTDVLNKTATEIGRTVARLLNQGFSLLSMLGLLKKRNRLAQRYMVVGDGNETLVESESGTPISANITQDTSDGCRVSVNAYPTKSYPMGSLVRPYITGEQKCYLNSGELNTFNVSVERLNDFLEMQLFPVISNDNLYWSDEYSV
ncbi:conserved hypothetical protein [Halomicrobium mukohataei DSM 12286]|uniref:CHAT domain-containing protein n=2 Tax=Halomicrobium mukohataei TaxID=57705 RepID=C7NWG6_HALMD|nr:conserved hypothetical protein [Halomicrobium mukohataei DSM 12286]